MAQAAPGARPGSPRPFGRLFLSAGAMKTGTSWLYRVLDTHPQLVFGPAKEMHYFRYAYPPSGPVDRLRYLAYINRRLLGPAPGAVRRAGASLTWLAAWPFPALGDRWFWRLFPEIPPGGYACEFSNLTAQLSEQAWRRIVANTEELRVLYTLRDPLDRLWSRVKFHFRATGRMAELDSWGAPEIEAHLRHPVTWEIAEYGKLLRRMKAVLPEGALLVQFQEERSADPAAALAGIEDFLGIARHAYPPELLTRRFNATPEAPMPEFMADLFGADVARICAELEDEGLVLPASWRR